MNKYLKYSLIGILVVAVLGAAAVGIAYAQDDPPTPHQILAELLGLTEAELSDLMQSGKSLADLAEEAGVNQDEIWQALQDARQEYSRARLQEALENGDLAEDHHNWLMEGIEKGFAGGGRGPGGFGFPGMLEGRGGTRPFGPGDDSLMFGRRGSFPGFGTLGSDCFNDRFED